MGLGARRTKADLADLGPALDLVDEHIVHEWQAAAAELGCAGSERGRAREGEGRRAAGEHMAGKS